MHFYIFLNGYDQFRGARSDNIDFLTNNRTAGRQKRNEVDDLIESAINVLFIHIQFREVDRLIKKRNGCESLPVS
eukprot:m.152821 g.152821  ORF g.152821 m.152821 type:complete len:75 (-) comp23416_c0_seq1:3674-3898(-)